MARRRVNPADHIGLVYRAARLYAKRCYEPVEDLVQEGVIGLVTAARKFDPERGVKFNTYAYWWISATINRYIKQVAPFVHTPHRPIAATPRVVSIESKTSSGETISRLLKSSYPSPEHEAMDRERSEVLWRTVHKCLPSRAAMVLVLHYLENKTFAQIGDVLGISRERARQIELEALVLLRPKLEELL